MAPLPVPDGLSQHPLPKQQLLALCCTSIISSPSGPCLQVGGRPQHQQCPAGRSCTASRRGGQTGRAPPGCNHSLIASCSFTIQVKPSLLGRMGSLMLRGMELSDAQQWALCSATRSPGSAAAPTAMPFPPEELSVLLNEQHRVNHHCLERMGFGPSPCSTPCAAQSITPCCQTAQSKQPTHAPRLPTEHRGWMSTVSKRLKLHLWKPGGALWGPENNICSAGKGPQEPPQPKPKL